MEVFVRWTRYASPLGFFFLFKMYLQSVARLLPFYNSLKLKSPVLQQMMVCEEEEEEEDEEWLAYRIVFRGSCVCCNLCFHPKQLLTITQLHPMPSCTATLCVLMAII